MKVCHLTRAEFEATIYGLNCRVAELKAAAQAVVDGGRLREFGDAGTFVEVALPLMAKLIRVLGSSVDVDGLPEAERERDGAMDPDVWDENDWW